MRFVKPWLTIKNKLCDSLTNTVVIQILFLISVYRKILAHHNGAQVFSAYVFFNVFFIQYQNIDFKSARMPT